MLLVSCSAGRRITANLVGIYNNSNAKMTIQLGETLKTMQNFTLKKHETWLSPNYNADPIIKIQTNDQVVTYTLQKGDYYMIYWNDMKKYWDVQKMNNR